MGPLNQSGTEPAIFYEWSMGPADLNKSLYEKQMSQDDRWGIPFRVLKVKVFLIKI